MREILFRGKRKEDGEWVEGSLVTGKLAAIECKESITAIFPKVLGFATLSNFDKVFPETVGQWTGLVDKDGVKIFEDDIIECSVIYDIGCYPHTKTETRVVAYRNGCFAPFCDCEVIKCKVVGNIHDDREILEAK